MTQHFLRNKQYVFEFVRNVYVFPNFSSLTPNFTKCEVAGICLLKGVKLAVCGMKFVHLTSDTRKTFGVHTSSNKTI